MVRSNESGFAVSRVATLLKAVDDVSLVTQRSAFSHIKSE